MVVQLTIQGIFPAKFQKPAAYLLAACRKQFASLLLHAYAHDHFAVFVCADATAADRVRTFASDCLRICAKTARHSTYAWMESERSTKVR